MTAPEYIVNDAVEMIREVRPSATTLADVESTARFGIIDDAIKSAAENDPTIPTSGDAWVTLVCETIKGVELVLSIDAGFVVGVALPTHRHGAAQRENDSTYDAVADTCESCR